MGILIVTVLLLQINLFSIFSKSNPRSFYSYIILIYVNTNPSSFFSVTNLSFTKINISESFLNDSVYIENRHFAEVFANDFPVHPMLLKDPFMHYVRYQGNQFWLPKDTPLLMINGNLTLSIYGNVILMYGLTRQVFRITNYPSIPRFLSTFKCFDEILQCAESNARKFHFY